MSEVKLPRMHFSVRVPWNDTGWDGRICADPAANHSCLSLKNIRENRVDDAEAKVAGRSWNELEESQLPPCVLERGGWLAPFSLTRHRNHPYADVRAPTHLHMKESAIEIPPRTAIGVPFRWMRREEAPDIAAEWRFEYDRGLEDAADRVLEEAGRDWKPDWVQDHRNQIRLLETFFSAAREGESLLFAYAKRIPLVEGEEELQPRRVLVGATTIRRLGPIAMWEEERPGPLSAAQWERPMHHDLRPADGSDGSHRWKGGVLLPYQELLRNPDLIGQDLSRFVAAVPDHLVTRQFSYATEHVTNDGAVDALTALLRAIDEVRQYVPGNWPEQAAWINDKLNAVWQWRGAFPGIGSALTAAGVPGGTIAAMTVLEGSGASDPWPALLAALGDAVERKGPLAGLVSKAAALSVLGLSEERLSLLKLLARMDLSAEQAARMFTPEGRANAGHGNVSDGAILANPYLLYELDRLTEEPIALITVDRGAMPAPGDDSGSAPIVDAVDERRVRAAMVRALELGTAHGHTLKPQADLLADVAELELEPTCSPTSDLLGAIRADLSPAIVQASLADDSPAWQLGRLAAAGGLIRNQIEARVRRGRPHDVEANWAEAVDAVIETDPDPNDKREVEAREEKADALETLARSRFSVLVGPAGTGKTTLIRALCNLPEVAGGGVVLLAPTGKAVVQLSDKVRQPARTLAGFLLSSGRYDVATGRYRLNGRAPEPIAETVIIDEASMLTEEMLAAVLESVTGVKRLVLVGDHRQLPPIGAGRPFRDAVELCREAGSGYAALRVIRRQAGGGDDLLLAAWFASDSVGEVLDDQVWARAANSESDAVRLLKWDDESDLHAKVRSVLAESFGLEEGEDGTLKASLGAEPNGEWMNFPRENPAHKVDSWQLLSPVRYRDGGVVRLNEMIRDTYRPWTVRNAIGWQATSAPPGGAYRVTSGDKVIVNRNERRDGWQFSERRAENSRLMANGEVGVLDGPYVKKGKRPKPKKRYLYLSTQPEWRYTVWNWDFGEDSGDLLDLAYALTVHKAQGSQFGITLIVIPQPCILLSPELLYTALTRQTERVIILHQGDLADLRRLANPVASETARRLTNLFRAPDPTEVEGSEHLLDRNLIHRARRGHLVRSKSEVIVADALHAHGVDYQYERWFSIGDGGPDVLPDFTIQDDATGELVVWEHLGMLDATTYRDKWARKKQRYAKAGILPWDEGGGTRGTLVTTTEERGIDSRDISELVKQVFAR